MHRNKKERPPRGGPSFLRFVFAIMPLIASAFCASRFTPESGHLQCGISCPLWAKSGLMHCSKHFGAEDFRTSLFVCAYHNFSEVFSPLGMSKRLRRPTEGKDTVDLRAQLVLLQRTKQVAEHCTGPDAHGM
jgi:hypothetical protein